MQRDASAAILSVVLVDYDNLYLSLKRKSDDAAKRFAKDAGNWVRELVSGALITPTGSMPLTAPRRLVMNRCYGNPVPRRNAADSSTDMSSFPFVRHHFLRSGFEVIDCPPLTAQLKNSSDIRMVMDINDLLSHRTQFDEFIILSSDADFTPVLHRLRAYARRTVIYANDSTVAPYTALADGEVREADLLTLLTGGKLGATDNPTQIAAQPKDIVALRGQIIAEVVRIVREAPAPVPLETLAERTTRTLGHDRTVGSGWAGAGSFRELLIEDLPPDVQLSEQPPYQAFDLARVVAKEQPAITHAAAAPAKPAATSQSFQQPTLTEQPARSVMPSIQQPAPQPKLTAPSMKMPAPQTAAPTARVQSPVAQSAPAATPTPAPILSQPLKPMATEPSRATASPARNGSDMATQIQQSIARIHDACQAPPLAPPEYRMVFEVLAREISVNQLQGVHTINNVIAQARDMRLELKREDVRFILDVVSEADPWFEQGATANLFASRFRNFVVQRCRTQGLNLSADELDLIDAWFTGGSLAAAQPVVQQPIQSPIPAEAREWFENADRQAVSAAGSGSAQRSTIAGGYEPAAQAQSAPYSQALATTGYAAPAGYAQQAAAPQAAIEDDYPRILRSRIRS